MKHRFRRFRILIVFLCLSAYGRSQGFLVTADKPFQVDRVLDTGIIGRLNREGAPEMLSAKELEYLYWVNLMRQDPREFHLRYVVPFLQQFPEAVSDESRSLAPDMRGLPTLPLLSPSRDLYRASASHAGFLSRTGRISHSGEGGKDFRTRMAEAGVTSCAGEVIFEGKDDMLVALILLLIDHRVPGLGHRKSLLNPEFTRTGVAVHYSRDGRSVMVQDLSCK